MEVADAAAEERHQDELQRDDEDQEGEDGGRKDEDDGERSHHLQQVGQKLGDELLIELGVRGEVRIVGRVEPPLAEAILGLVAQVLQIDEEQFAQMKHQVIGALGRRVGVHERDHGRQHANGSPSEAAGDEPIAAALRIRHHREDAPHDDRARDRHQELDAALHHCREYPGRVPMETHHASLEDRPDEPVGGGPLLLLVVQSVFEELLWFSGSQHLSVLPSVLLVSWGHSHRCQA